MNALLLCLILPGADLRSTVSGYDTLPPEGLERIARERTGQDRALASLFLASGDTGHAAASAVAVAYFDSLHAAAPTPLDAALLGTAEALQARRFRGEVVEATRWVGKAISHLDEAVRGDSLDTDIRIFRVHSLVEVPEIFRVDEKLRRDEAFLRRLAPRLADGPTPVLLALAALDQRFGKLDEAVAIWKLVASRPGTPAVDRRAAKRRLEALHG